MTSMRSRYVTSTSVRRHVPAGNFPPSPWPPNILNLPTPMEMVCYRTGRCVDIGRDIYGKTFSSPTKQ